MSPNHNQPPKGDVLNRLRDSTRSLHDRLEARLGLPENIRSPGQYRRLLEDFHGFYAPLEEALAAADWTGTGICFAERQKLPWLKQDLGRLGLSSFDIENLPVCRSLPETDSISRAFGSLYVVEGATLGGQVISRHARTVVADDGQLPCAFFSSYGDRVGAMWRGFRQAVSNVSGAEDQDRVVAAARDTFERLEGWLFRRPQ